MFEQISLNLYNKKAFISHWISIAIEWVESKLIICSFMRWKKNTQNNSNNSCRGNNMPFIWDFYVVNCFFTIIIQCIGLLCLVSEMNSVRSFVFLFERKERAAFYRTIQGNNWLSKRKASIHLHCLISNVFFFLFFYLLSALTITRSKE